MIVKGWKEGEERGGGGERERQIRGQGKGDRELMVKKCSLSHRGLLPADLIFWAQLWRESEAGHSVLHRNLRITATYITVQYSKFFLYNTSNRLEVCWCRFNFFLQKWTDQREERTTEDWPAQFCLIEHMEWVYKCCGVTVPVVQANVRIVDGLYYTYTVESTFAYTETKQNRL